ncbi:glycosyltransferase family 2 protein [Collinsella sp. LCP19S3_A6]|uniref:glycosyltransferase family 2 protein n=1 Tax=Collinsella sp. LCP19S3_A6 TaxID=3438752 RepID=UPI003F9072F1
MEFGFVVLHYKEVDATRSCIDSIKSICNGQGAIIRIVVVDNGSLDGSGELLQDYYYDDPIVDVVVSSENLGFARGNNLGLETYKKLYGVPNYLIACNNDILITDPLFLKKVQLLHAEYNFDVLGPDVFNPNTHEHQSPCDEAVVTLEAIDRLILNCKSELALYREPSPLERVKLAVRDSSIFRACAAMRHKFGLFEKQRKWNVTQENVVLHGSFLVFEQNYLQRMPWLFSPVTFMYFEEFFLHLCSIQNELKLLYSPEVQILHLHGVSTSADRPKWSQRQLFYYENLLNSLEEYKKTLSGL